MRELSEEQKAAIKERDWETLWVLAGYDSGMPQPNPYELNDFGPVFTRIQDLGSCPNCTSDLFVNFHIGLVCLGCRSTISKGGQLKKKTTRTTTKKVRKKATKRTAAPPPGAVKPEEPKEDETDV